MLLIILLLEHTWSRHMTRAHLVEAYEECPGGWIFTADEQAARFATTAGAGGSVALLGVNPVGVDTEIGERGGHRLDHRRRTAQVGLSGDLPVEHLGQQVRGAIASALIGALASARHARGSYRGARGGIRLAPIASEHAGLSGGARA